MDLVNALIDNYNIPIMSAFALGILGSVSPCTLTTNITAVAYISKEIKSARQTLFNGIAYTIGRGISYVVLAAVIYFGISAFKISSIFQGWGDKVLGIVLVIIGLIMFDIIKLSFVVGSQRLDRIKIWLAGKGYLGSLLLGVIFSLAFCPYGGVLFFGVLMPLVVSSREGLFLPIAFALGTGLPVIIFSFLLAFSAGKVGKMFNAVRRIEKIMRYAVASIFIIVGLYYTQFLARYLLNLL